MNLYDEDCSWKVVVSVYLFEKLMMKSCYSIILLLDRECTVSLFPSGLKRNENFFLTQEIFE